MGKPRIEIVFRKGKPTSAFFHLREGSSGKTGRQIPIRPTFVAHYDDAGHPSGLEVPLPLVASAWMVNDALRELGGSPVDEVDLAPLRSL
ncbi:MAG: hypothetical protein HOW73_24775 [Polyangiaceae bacterium]|nr:hypothetical protein [Polyangiaceae bacterium]